MKIRFLMCIGIGLILITCKNSSNGIGNDAKLNIKSVKIREELKKEGINSFYQGDSLIIVDKQNNEIKKIKTYASDTLYRIVQSENDHYLFIGLASFGDCVFQQMGLIDLKSRKWIVNIKLNTKSDDWKDCVLPNPAYLGTTTDNKYHLFEGGTGVIREFQVYNSSGYLIKKGSYMSDADDKQLHWDRNNKFYYFDRTESVPDSLPKPKENNGYVQKKFWFNDKDSVTNEFKEVYFE